MVEQQTIVRVRELALSADIGINPDEIGRKQPLVVSVELSLGSAAADRIDETVDYRRIVAEAETLARVHIPLIETFARRLARNCIAWTHVREARVTVEKPFALPNGKAGAEVTLRRP